jgi:hypothetical protein
MMPGQLLFRVHIALLVCFAEAAVVFGAQMEAAAGSRAKFIPTFAIKYGGPTGWPALEDAARFDLIVLGAGTARNENRVATPGNTWQVLKALNPGLVLLLYEIGPGEYNAASWRRIGQFIPAANRT